jgi:hypothetical protein
MPSRVAGCGCGCICADPGETRSRHTSRNGLHGHSRSTPAGRTAPRTRDSRVEVFAVPHRWRGLAVGIDLVLRLLGRRTYCSDEVDIARLASGGRPLFPSPPKIGDQGGDQGRRTDD